MSRFRKIEVRTWADERFRSLSPIQPSGQGLWFFLLTGPHTGPIPGLFRAGRGQMADELGWDLEAFDEAFGEVFAQGMAEADFKAKLVWLPKALKHNPPESPNVVRSWRVELDLLPECDLKRKAIESMRAALAEKGYPYVEAFDELFKRPGNNGSGKPSGKPFGKPSPKPCPNQEQEQEQEKEQEEHRVPAEQSPAEAPPESPPEDPPEDPPEAARSKPQPTEDDFKCARWLFGCLQRVNPTAKPPNWNGWADDIRLMRVRDKRTHLQICELYAWAKKDDFWSANIIAPGKLREKWDTLVEQRARPVRRAQQPQQATIYEQTMANAEKARELIFGPRAAAPDAAAAAPDAGPIIPTMGGDDD